MNDEKDRLTLDRPVIYQIKLPGILDVCWADWDGELTVTVVTDDEGSPVTVLTGPLDQAALQGLLRRLYSLGIPLMSVEHISAS